MNDHDRDREAVPPPTLIADRYRIVSPLGSGGMADVYLAEDERLGRPVAIKVLKARLASDREFVERFRIEARAAACLGHPGIVAVYDRGSANGVTYIVMEHVRGESLKQRLRRDGALPADEAVAIALAVLSALESAHARSIVHRDVTASNVLLEEGGRVVVTDFGIARMGDSSLTRTGALMGTSSYLSPEQAKGAPADERSDLYALGVVLYEMLTGRVPFRGDTDVAVALQHVSAAPPNPRVLAPGVSEALAGVVMRALRKDPADRYQTAAEFAAALRAARLPRRTAGAPDPGADLAGRPVTVSPAAGRPAACSPAAVVASPATVPPAVSASVPATVAPTSAPAAATAVAAEAPTRYRSRGELMGGEPATGALPRRRRLPRLVLVLVALALAATGAWAAYAYLLAPGVTVPGVVGRERAAASAEMRGEDLQPSFHLVWSDKYDAGEVVRQSPRPGAKVDDGAAVDLWVSRGPLHLPAPDLKGLAASTALGRLEGRSLHGKTRKAASESVPRGKIIRQKPAAGETVRRGDTVTFWVSTGPPPADVPDVVGLSQGDATAALEEAGFVVAVDFVFGWGAYPGDVVAQDPEPGARARKGDKVVIEVAVF